jgi:hypothetical protein
MRYAITSRVCAVAVLFSSYLPAVNAAIVDYQLTFTAITGPSGTGSFQYDATPGAEWMSDIALDFGPGLTATVITEYNPATDPFGNADAGLFEIFSDGSLFERFYQWMRVWNSVDNASLRGESPVIDGEGIYQIDFARNGPVYPNLPNNFEDPIQLDGPFYVFYPSDVAGDYHYGTISLTAVPVPAALPLFASALAAIGLSAARRHAADRSGADGSPRSLYS